MAGILKKSDLAIIMPVLNCLNYTKQMLPTIKTKHPYRLIIIDNGSTDGTKEFFNSGVRNFLIDYFYFKENKGCAASWNYGIKYAIRHFGSTHFFIPNNDILLHPEAIDILLKTIQKKDVVLATAIDVAGKISGQEEFNGLLPPVKTLLSEAPEFSCFMLNLKAIEKVGYFDEAFYPAYFEDNDYHHRIKLAGLKAIKTNRALYFHYHSRTIKENEDIRNKSNLGYNLNQEYYIKKWGGLPGHEKLSSPGANS
ncbi:MAG: glycosyltransferase [Candidatus Omnitrophica bacterium]|nr:glycosyltransferase [Candidatus Omnitrophota bacterium]MDD5353153.1 glycosyltransferase [Candidatus Omnitrophota bacterium]MDD5551133.1 glycosyltransferase [Candidatus Omnitrophota bacterium]